MYAPFQHPPGHDFANVPPHLPANSEELDPLFRRVSGSVMLAIATGILVNLLFRFLLDMEDHTSGHQLLSDFFALMSGVCFWLCGLSLFYRGVVMSVVLLFSGIVFVFLAG